MPTPPPSPVVHLTAEIESAATDWVTRKDAGLSPAEERAFAEWFSADGRHARAYDRAAAAWAVFDRAQQSGAAADILEGLATRARRRRQRRLQAATAAAFVLCAAWFFPWGREAAPRGEGSATPGLPAGASQLANRNDVRRLPDGSVVELKPGAEIAVNYEAAARHVRLVKGEAFFRVAKDPARPFLVETNGIEVRAVGTAFSVQVQPGAIEVFVKEGAVDVGDAPIAGATGAPGGSPSAVRVEAGRKFIAMIKLRPAMRLPGAVTTPAGEPAAPQPVTEEEMDRQLAWRETWLEFAGTTIAEAVTQMNGHNQLQIEVADPAIGALRVTGSFRSDNPEGFVRIVEGTFELKAEYRGAHAIILRRRP